MPTNRNASYIVWKVRFVLMTLLLVVLTAFFTQIVLCQTNSVDKQFLEIIPGVSRRSDVENRLGKEDPTRHIVTYNLPNFTLNVLYSYGGCNSTFKNTDFPEWTVEEVNYSNFSSNMALESVIRRRKDFVVQKRGDVTVHSTYRNMNDGISIVYDTKEKSVIYITLTPTAKIRLLYSC